MDKADLGNEVSEEVTRESLIAISNDLPESNFLSGSSPANSNKETLVKAVNGDGREKYISELISISYTDSPDTVPVPAVGDIKG